MGEALYRSDWGASLGLWLFLRGLFIVKTIPPVFSLIGSRKLRCVFFLTWIPPMFFLGSRENYEGQDPIAERGRPEEGCCSTFLAHVYLKNCCFCHLGDSCY